jgi:hypothetical protein
MWWTVVAWSLISLGAGAAVLAPVYLTQKRRESLREWGRQRGWTEDPDESVWRSFLIATFGGSEVSRVVLPLSGRVGDRAGRAMEYRALVRRAGAHDRFRVVLRPYTVVAVELAGPVDSLEITSTEHDDHVLADVGGDHVLTGYRGLDEAYRVRTRNVEAVRRVLRPEVVEGLSTLLPRTNFVFTGTWLIAWEPTIMVPVTLERIVGVATWLADMSQDPGPL